MTDAIIIGGGLAGLSAAVALADNGLQVIVIERDTCLGGRARSRVDALTGDTIDIGPHVVHSEYRNVLALLDRLGTRELITWQKDKVLTLAGRAHPVVLRHWPLPPPLSLFPAMLAAPELSMRDYLSITRSMWRGMTFGEEDVDALDHMTALDFMRDAGVSERMIDWWWRFAAMVVANVPLERCSAAALMRIHAQLSGHRRLHFGFAAVGLADLYAPQAEHVIRSAHGDVLMRTAVRGFLGSDRVEGVVLEDGTELRARWCISAIPPLDLAPIVPDAWKARPPFDVLASFEPCPYISCYLWFDRTITDERFVSHLWSPTRLNYDFYDLAKIRHGWAHRPSLIASNIIYSHRAHGMSDDEIIRATVDEIAEFAPEAKQAGLRHAQVHRIPMAIPCPIPGAERKRPDVRTWLDGLILAGDWVRTHLPFSMESAVCSGWLAAEQVLADIGKPQALARAQRPNDGLAGFVRSATILGRKLTRPQA